MIQVELDTPDTVLSEEEDRLRDPQTFTTRLPRVWQVGRRSRQVKTSNRSQAGSNPTFQAALGTEAVKVSVVRVLWRLLRLLMFGLRFAIGTLCRRLTIRHLEERQRLDAIQFREMVERLGGAIIKVGQQMSQRTDFFPPAYCDELEHLLGEIPQTIDRADVIATIERQIRRPMTNVFAEFEYKPVGSASVSCVYRAVLHSGDEVAVKVRRPHIRKQFTADLTALDWILRGAEFICMWRPGMSQNLRDELTELLLEELDFRLEARYQELFRRYLKRWKKVNVTAPKVHYELSGEEVLVTEFVRGYWVNDIIGALERGDEQYLERLRCAEIEPRIVAKRLIRSRCFTFFECPLFHGDPHPANILVQPKNKIVMVDFGACGVFSERDRHLMWQMNCAYAKDDVAGMVNMVISLMEPVPHADMTQFRRELLDYWWIGFYGIKSKHAAGWERTSFRLWLRFFELIRKYQIPVPKNMIRMLRATLLYDTAAARLDNKINVFKEFEKYSRRVARQARRRIEISAVRQLLMGPDDSTFLKLQQIANVGNGVLNRVQNFLDDPEFNLLAMADKIFYAIQSFVGLLLSGASATVVGGVVAVIVDHRHFDVVLHPSDTWHLLFSDKPLEVVASGWLFAMFVLTFTYAKRVMWRFGDIDED